MAEAEGPTISTTLPARRDSRWSGAGSTTNGRSVRILISASFAVSSVLIHENANVIFLLFLPIGGKKKRELYLYINLKKKTTLIF